MRPPQSHMPSNVTLFMMVQTQSQSFSVKWPKTYEFDLINIEYKSFDFYRHAQCVMKLYELNMSYLFDFTTEKASLSTISEW